MALAFNPIRPRSLGGQLVGLVAALAVPLVTLQVWWGYRESQRAEEAVVTQALAIADATALSLRQFLAQAEATVTGTSTDFGRQLLTGQACGPAMQTLVNLFPSFSNVTTVNRDGSLACSANPVPEWTSATSWAWFPEMAEAEDPQYTIAGPVLGPMSGEWILPLVTPIVDEQGRFAGAVVGSVPLVGFARFMSGDRQGADLLVTIATAEHIVIARSEKAELWVGQPLPPVAARTRPSDHASASLPGPTSKTSIADGDRSRSRTAGGCTRAFPLKRFSGPRGRRQLGKSALHS